MKEYSYKIRTKTQMSLLKGFEDDVVYLKILLASFALALVTSTLLYHKNFVDSDAKATANVSRSIRRYRRIHTHCNCVSMAYRSFARRCLL